MASGTFKQSEVRLPGISDVHRFETARERLIEAVGRLEEGALRADLDRVLAEERCAGLLGAVLGNSPFLTECLIREPMLFLRFCEENPSAIFDEILSGLETELRGEQDRSRAMKALRVAKRKVALLIALADIGGVWDLTMVTGALSRFATVSTRLSLDVALRIAIRNGDLLPGAEDEDPDQSHCGLVIIGMGKLGAGELNYSSDVDLIAFFEPDCSRLTGKRMPTDSYVRITRDIVALMQERTADGYVFRVDLRLRPDPGATPLAVSLPAAEIYYTSVGQNWERAAMIKARILAGDRQAGTEFLHLMQPFIWRKFLDFAAIRDIQSIKRQIAAHKGGYQIELAGHNVKLGRGGIREIEFFAQTQQLIRGGRQQELRVARTLDALQELVHAGLLPEADRQRLEKAYIFLRTVEHRLQMINDQQTQTLPESDQDLDHLAIFLGYDGRQAFAEDLLHHLRTVAGLYGDLFRESDSLGAETGQDEDSPGSLVFTGEDDHPDTLRTLEKLGFARPEQVTATVRVWHRGRIRATRSERSRQILTELMPCLLAAMGKTADPDAALLRFDEFLGRLPAGVQFLSLLSSNRTLLDLIAEIMGSAPGLASMLSQHPVLLDSVLDQDFERPVGSSVALCADLDAVLASARDYQDVMEFARRWANDRKFQLGIRILRRQTDAHQAGGPLSDIADTVISRLLPCIEEEFARKHGHVPGGSLAVIAYGKLGSREMTFTSDLDLVFVYHVLQASEGQPAVMSDGEKPLSPSVYYQRLSQRVINALSARMGEGILYETDMRLRPSGNQGPIACSLESFLRYQKENAWTWEHMALTRSRVVAGPPDLTSALACGIRKQLCTARDPVALKKDVADMRERMAAEHKPEGDFDLKHRRGGLVDLEFVTQYLLLLHGPEEPALFDTGIASCLSRLTEFGILPEEDGRVLIESCRLWHRLSGLLRLTVGDAGFDIEKSPPGLKSLLCYAGGVDNEQGLKSLMQEKLDAVKACFEKYPGS